jgi:hypothetical protein
VVKVTLSYLAGALTIAGAVYLAAGRASAVMFALGVLTPVLILAAALSSRTRLQRVARLMLSIAGPPECLSRVKVGTRRTAKRSTEAKPEPAPSQIEQDIASALANFGARKSDAATAARYAVQARPAAGFDELFRIALNKSKLAA